MQSSINSPSFSTIQVSVKKEPQNTEQGIINVEGKEYFSISASGGFDIRYSNLGTLICKAQR
jgi:hypothetical protein